MLRATCLCGNAAYEVSGEIHSPRYCHCQNCRKFSGTAFAAWGIVQADVFKLTSSEADIQKYDSGGGLRAFCNTCGSPLWFEPAENSTILGVPLGAFDEGDVPAPAMHVWTQSKAPWTSIDDELPQSD